jgi:hypothetical protein
VAHLSALTASTLGALTLAVHPAPGAGKLRVISHAQVLAIALRVARLDGDAHPSRVAVASGRLEKAVKVFDPEAHPTAFGLKALGGAKSVVDLVAMRGRFTSHGPHPHNRPEPKGRVLELIMDAQSGNVFAVSLGPKMPAPLSRLGPVTRLR